MTDFRGRRQALTADSTDWVRPVAEAGPPLEVSPVDNSLDLVRWAGEHPEVVCGWLERWGAVLFRGFRVGLEGMGAAARVLAGEPLPYTERSSPRTEIGDRIYTSTDYPADMPIPLHNENSYQYAFPRRIVFGCVTAPGGGGATSLADTRAVLRRIPPRVVDRFAETGVLYVRNYVPHVGIGWQEAFQTADRAEVDAYCARAGIEAEWRPDGGLRTRAVRPTIAVHPDGGEASWFNHAAFFHVSSLPAEVGSALVSMLSEEDYPSTTCYGDGASIDGADLAAIRAAYAAEKRLVDWRHGDVLLVDNLACAHGREPFTGERRIVVAMAGPATWPEVDARGRAAAAGSGG